MRNKKMFCSLDWIFGFTSQKGRLVADWLVVFRQLTAGFLREKSQNNVF